jgi:Zn finger protein HypA/HybF involved in hydrogenase expression
MPCEEPARRAPAEQPSDPAEASVYCPRCDARLAEHRCKLVCPRCGYYLSCADYY